MKLLITGGAGFLGARLARQLLAKGQLAGSTLTQIVLADQFPAPADLAADPRVEVLTGPLLEQCAGFAQRKFDGVFHLASAVSGECEADFDLGMRSNLDSTRALLDAVPVPDPVLQRKKLSESAADVQFHRLRPKAGPCVFGEDHAQSGTACWHDVGAGHGVSCRFWPTPAA